MRLFQSRIDKEEDEREGEILFAAICNVIHLQKEDRRVSQCTFGHLDHRESERERDLPNVIGANVHTVSLFDVKRMEKSKLPFSTASVCVYHKNLMSYESSCAPCVNWLRHDIISIL